MKTSYSHQNDPDDSIYQGDKYFLEVMARITSLDEKGFFFQYQQELKTKVLHYKKLQLTVEEKS